MLTFKLELPDGSTLIHEHPADSADVLTSCDGGLLNHVKTFLQAAGHRVDELIAVYHSADCGRIEHNTEDDQ